MLRACAGSSEDRLYLRARIAVHGLLAPSREETVLTLADSDSATFDGNCNQAGQKGAAA
jgi:hypothetical protein